MTIIIVAHNQINELKISLKTIHLLERSENLSVIVVDNASSDETREWLAGQSDIHMLFTEQFTGYSSIINEVVDAFDIDEELVLLQPDHMITPECLQRMKNVLYEEKTAAVLSLSEKFGNYNEAVNIAKVYGQKGSREVTYLHNGVFMLRNKILKEIGFLNDQFMHSKETIAEYGANIIRAGFAVKEALGAVIYTIPAQDALKKEKAELTILKKKSILLLKHNVPIWGYIVGQIAEAYRSIGWEPHILDIEEEANVSQTLELIKAGLDRVLVLNNVGYFLGGEETHIWDIYGIKICNYLLDHPFYYQETLDRSPSNAICICVDRNHAKYINRFCQNVRKTVFLPLAGDNELDYITYEWIKRKTDVLFVGNYKGYRENGMPDEEFYILLEELMNNTQITFEAAVEQMLRLQKSDIHTYDAQIKACVEKNKYIDANIMAYYRCKLIEILIKSGIDVVVHGVGWESFEYFDHPHFIYGGAILHEECIEKMKESKIVLNIMPWFKDGIHDRVINAMLAGAVCVTDDSIYMSETFEKDKDYICYSLDAMEKLPDMIRSILDNEDTTQEMRQNAYQKAKEGHRWLHRIKELEALLDEGYVLGE